MVPSLHTRSTWREHRRPQRVAGWFSRSLCRPRWLVGVLRRASRATWRRRASIKQTSILGGGDALVFATADVAGREPGRRVRVARPATPTGAWGGRRPTLRGTLHMGGSPSPESVTCRRPPRRFADSLPAGNVRSDLSPHWLERGHSLPSGSRDSGHPPAPNRATIHR